MKKMLAIVICMFMVSTVFAGCSTTTTPTSSDTTAPAAETSSAKETVLDSGAKEGAEEMEMWVFVELHGKFYETMLKEWNELNPDKQLNIKMTTLPYDDMHNKLQISLQSGEGAPDLCDVEIGKFPNFLMGTPQLEVLNDVVEPYKKDIVQSRLDIYSKDGNIYGLPTHVGATVMFYNTELLDQAGVDYTKIITWDDYLAAGKTVVEKTGKMMGVAETSATWTLSAMLAQQGSDYTTADGKVNIDTPEALRAVEQVQTFLKEGIVAVPPGGQPDTEESYGYINQGEVASFAMPLWFMSRFLDYMPDLSGKFAIAPIPVFEAGMPRSVGLGGTGTVVTKTAKNAALAKEWLAYAKLSESGTRKIWDTLGFDPVNMQLWDDEALTKDPNNKFLQYFKTNPFDTLLAVKDEIQAIKSTSASPTIYNVLGTQVLNDLYESSADAKTTLKEAQDQIANQLS